MRSVNRDVVSIAVREDACESGASGVTPMPCQSSTPPEAATAALRALADRLRVGIRRQAFDHRNAAAGDAPDMMAEEMDRRSARFQDRRIDVLRCGRAVRPCGPRRCEGRRGRLADHGAGDIEIVAIFVGARADDGIVEGDGIGFARHDVIAEFRAAGQLIGRAGPDRLGSRALHRVRISLRAPLTISGIACLRAADPDRRG